jgi:hypothetical protein
VCAHRAWFETTGAGDAAEGGDTSKLSQLSDFSPRVTGGCEGSALESRMRPG